MDQDDDPETQLLLVEDDSEAVDDADLLLENTNTAQASRGAKPNVPRERAVVDPAVTLECLQDLAIEIVQASIVAQPQVWRNNRPDRDHKWAPIRKVIAHKHLAWPDYITVVRFSLDVQRDVVLPSREKPPSRTHGVGAFREGGGPSSWLPSKCPRRNL